MFRIPILFLLSISACSCSAGISNAGEDRPHAVFVVGTPHYNPAATMPELAKQLESLGFKTTVILPKENPEKNKKGLSGLRALKDADLAVFFLRFLTLPDSQLKLITDYLESGKPVVAFRTTGHGFAYPEGSPHAAWNSSFGRNVMGSEYYIHLKGTTEVSIHPSAKHHPILKSVGLPATAAGTLYLAKPPADATVLLTGTGRSKTVGAVTNAFGTHQLKAEMTEPVAWTFKNKWGGRTFSTTLGHPDTFRDKRFVRLFLNGICWAAEKEIPKRIRVKSIAPDPKKDAANPQVANMKDGRNTATGRPDPYEDPEYQKYGIYANTTPRAKDTDPVDTALPLKLNKGDRIALVGNTLFDRGQQFGYFETMLHQRYPHHNLIVRTLAWPADTVDLQPRPANFADQDQHLTYEQIDVIFAAYGYSESFAGVEGLTAFRESLTKYIQRIKSKAFNGEHAPQILLVSPTANEDVPGVAAATLNNENIKLYTAAMKDVAAEQNIGFINAFEDTLAAMKANSSDDKSRALTLNGVHLLEEGYQVFARSLFRQTFGEDASAINEELRANIIDKNRQYFRRYRPLNTFYYTGGRNKSYGYLDFLPAMKNFDIMTANRDQRSWDIAADTKVAATHIDDSNVPELPETKQSRGANRWISAADELQEFEVDPRFEVNLFAGEEEFPEIAAPIQIRWDTLGRLWVACSTTYPHVYPGKEPNDRIVILEDTDNDGKADKSTVFADDIHIPLSFEFGNGGIYVSEEPHLTFLKDTDGDGKADLRQELLTGFGTEDSHHALHDFVWTPDGDLMFRESIFHHTQVETPYGPVRQQNSGWFRFDPVRHKLTSFGTYHSTNPWGVTFDQWGQHMASHPVYAAAFHSLDPPYPTQHQKPVGLQAYSGTCGQEFVDFTTFPDELQGHFIKARYKPTNRIEIHQWKEGPFGFEEEYVSDLIFSKNLSFIPVDLRFGPRGAMYVCDWYNPVKGHAQYSLRDERRDRHSGRIWRITAKNKPLQTMPQIDGATAEDLLELLKRPEYRIRYLVKHELRKLSQTCAMAPILDEFVRKLDPAHPRFRQHQLEALWAYRICRVGGRQLEVDRRDHSTAEGKHSSDSGEALEGIKLLYELLFCDQHMARAAAVEQLRYWHYELGNGDLPTVTELLQRAANDENGIVRMQAAIACSHIGTPEALDACLLTLNHPAEKHTAYAIQCALGSHKLRRHWEKNPKYDIDQILHRLQRSSDLKEPAPSASQAEFDGQKDLKTVRISCIPERMLFTVDQFAVTTGQPVKIVFTNPDATDHNLVLVKPGALAEVGMAANAMARDPQNANSDFIPEEKKKLILHASPLIGPTRKSQVHVLRFHAPTEPGIYPFVCTFPGHWVIMKGEMVVAKTLADIDSMLAAQKPKIVQKWKLADFEQITIQNDEETAMKGMQAFVKAGCNQCHVVAGHGINLGPDLTDVAKRYQGRKLLKQILEPSSEINKDYQMQQFVLKNGKLVSGVVVDESPEELKVVTNLLNPNAFVRVKRKEIDEQILGKVSAMPAGLADVLTKTEILELVSFLETGGYKLPKHLKKMHQH